MRTTKLLALLTTGVLVAVAGDSSGVVTGTVRHETVKKFATVVYLESASSREFAPPTTNPTVQLQQKFLSPRVLPVLVGTRVEFRNGDRRKHHVFSPDGEKYDLGECAKGGKRTHTFDRPGVYIQLCTRHPEMVSYIVAVRTPHFAVADQAGNFRIADVPAGTWKLKLWNERLAPAQLKKAYDVQVATGQDVKMDVAIESPPSARKYWLEPPPPAGASLVERGRWLFRQKGCFLCHGPEGSRGIRLRNYVGGTVPALQTLAERLMLSDPEDVRAIVEQMEQGQNLESLTASPPVPRFHVFLAKYGDARDVVRKGSSPGKKDPHGPRPPLAMPAWGQRLSDADINALIAYLLTLQPWEDQEK